MPTAFYLLFLLHTPQVETCGYKVGHGYAIWVIYHILFYITVKSLLLKRHSPGLFSIAKDSSKKD